MESEWDKEQFLTYLLLYAANADLVISPEEEDYIITTVGEEEYVIIKELFDEDSDAKRVERLIEFSQGEEFDQEYSMMVKNEMKDLFMSDGNYSHWEKSIGRALTRLMNL